MDGFLCPNLLDRENRLLLEVWGIWFFSLFCFLLLLVGGSGLEASRVLSEVYGKAVRKPREFTIAVLLLKP